MARTPLASLLLKEIADSYVDSSDFNGRSLHHILRERPEALESLKTLVSTGLVEVYSGEYDNPHKKRLPALSVEQQLGSLTGTNAEVSVCLYPSIKYMRRILPGSRFRSRPFTRLLALGHPQLEPIFFQMSVLERYQSDPRYVFRFNGLDGHISIKEKPYRSREMGEADKVMLETFGLGTNVKKGHRVVVGFLRYLSSLSARHQQHWQSYRVTGECKIERNYGLRSIWGQWTDGVSIYDALLEEISHINKMCQLIGLPELFRRDFSNEGVKDFDEGFPLDEPRGFGLLMKPTRKAFLDFAHVLDKIISENMNTAFFEAQGIQLEEQTTKNGQIVPVSKGTLRLLEEWLTKRVRVYDENGPSIILEPLKEVRKLRQSPAHKFVNDEFSLEYQKKKEKLIEDVYSSISNIRYFFQTHPQARSYPFPDEHLKPENLVAY
jgi:hypothetical protein